MEEIEYLLLSNVDIELLKKELNKYNLILKYISITKNINICDNYQLRLNCIDNNYYYIYLDGSNNFNCDKDIFFNILKKEYINEYIDYLISIRARNIYMYNKKLEKLKQHIIEEEKEIKKLKKYKS